MYHIFMCVSCVFVQSGKEWVKSLVLYVCPCVTVGMYVHYDYNVRLRCALHVCFVMCVLFV